MPTLRIWGINCSASTVHAHRQPPEQRHASLKGMNGMQLGIANGTPIGQGFEAQMVSQEPLALAESSNLDYAHI